MEPRDLSHEIESIATLDEPVRRRLYFYVIGRGGEVSRDRAAKGVGVSRALAAFHLDKLVEDGLLETSYRRLSKRKGPGAGRPSKLYRRSTRQVAVSFPPRQYELAARLLAKALEMPNPNRALPNVAREYGEALGHEHRGERSAAADRSTRLSSSVMQTLRDGGYEPYRADDGAIRMRNCPFHSLAQEHRSLVCGMNHELLDGLLEGLGVEGYRADLDPKPGECCVAIRRADQLR